MRTAPVPLYLLAEQVRANDLTVVITGEGADELFWGYDLFKEVVVRELNRTRARTGAGDARGVLSLPRRRRRAPRPRLHPLPARDRVARRSARLAPDPGRGDRHGQGVLPPGGRGRDRRDGVARAGSATSCRPAFDDWSTLERAAWLEVATLLEPYLLAAAGRPGRDGARGRGAVPVPRPPGLRTTRPGCPPERKLDGLRDKVALRELAADLLPEEIVARPKQPYRAPEVVPFFGPEAPEWVEESLSPAALREDRDLGRRDASPACFSGAEPAGRPGSARGWRWSGSSRRSSGTRSSAERGAGAYPAETARSHM